MSLTATNGESVWLVENHLSEVKEYIQPTAECHENDHEFCKA